MPQHLSLNPRDQDEIHKRLSWYEKVSTTACPAKYQVARRIACQIDLDEAPDEILWNEHRRLSEATRQLVDRTSSEILRITELPIPQVSFLDLKAKLLRRMIRRCTFCEWKCGVDRVSGVKKGACKLDSGESRKHLVCSLWRRTTAGGSRRIRNNILQLMHIQMRILPELGHIPRSIERGTCRFEQLALIMKKLSADGVLNINFVGGEPTPNLHTIVEAMNQLDLNVPMLWNSNMYCSEETMQILADLIDIWLAGLQVRERQVCHQTLQGPAIFRSCRKKP